MHLRDEMHRGSRLSGAETTHDRDVRRSPRPFRCHVAGFWVEMSVPGSPMVSTIGPSDRGEVSLSDLWGFAPVPSLAGSFGDL